MFISVHYSMYNKFITQSITRCTINPLLDVQDE